MKINRITGRLWLLGVAVAFSAGGTELELRDKAPPADVDASIRKLLQAKSVHVAPFEFWLVSDVQLTGKPAEPGKGLDLVKQAGLLGVLVMEKSGRDYRDDEIPAGAYTMRFILQPQDGNHLGTSEFPYFMALTPVKLDTKPDGITDYKALVKASSKETATDHPIILSLRPVNSEDGGLPKLTEPAPEHKSVRVKVPGSAGTEKTAVVFDLVYEGQGHK